MSPVRDRLGEMRRIQNGGSHVQAAAGSSEEISSTFQRAQTIRESIEVIRTNTAKANTILKNNAFKIPERLQSELDSLFASNTSTAYKINSGLKGLQDELKGKNSSSTECRIKNVQYTSLKKAFQEALQDSSSLLEFHKNNRRELLKQSLRTAQKNVNEEELEALLDNNKVNVFTDNLLAATAEAKQQLADIEERHKELLKIERHLNEVLDMFIKVATLVEQQQESVERVLYHAETATDCVELGAKDLGKTVRRRKKYNKRKICIILIAVLVILGVVLIFLL